MPSGTEPWRHADVLRRLRRGVLGGEADVRVVRQHDHVLGVDRGHALEDLPDRGVHRLPALDHDLRALAAEDVAVAASLRDCHERRGGVRRLRRGVQLREPALPLDGLAVHVADLDASGVDDADRASAVERALGLVGVHVHLRDRRVARRRAASRRAARGSHAARRGRASSPSTTKTVQYRYSDSSWWIDSSVISVGHVRHLGQRLAGELVEHAADELDQAGAAGVDDARLAELVEHARACGATASSPRATTRARPSTTGRARTSRSSGLLGHLADHGQHRPLHRQLHRLVGARRAGAERLGHHTAVDPLALAEDARHAADDRGEDDAGVALGLHRRGALHVRGQLCRRVGPERSSSATIPSIVFWRFVPVSPSGTG